MDFYELVYSKLYVKYSDKEKRKDELLKRHILVTLIITMVIIARETHTKEIHITVVINIKEICIDPHIKVETL